MDSSPTRRGCSCSAVQVDPAFEDKRRLVEIIRGIETGISKYLFTISAINIALGFGVGTAL